MRPTAAQQPDQQQYQPTAKRNTAEAKIRNIERNETPNNSSRNSMRPSLSALAIALHAQSRLTRNNKRAASYRSTVHKRVMSRREASFKTLLCQRQWDKKVKTPKFARLHIFIQRLGMKSQVMVQQWFRMFSWGNRIPPKQIAQSILQTWPNWLLNSTLVSVFSLPTVQ